MRVEPWLESDDGADDDAWDALCEARSELFQTSAVTRASEVFGGTTRRIRVLDGTGRPVAALALVEAQSRKLGPAAGAFTRFFEVFGGPLLLADDADAALCPAAVEAFAADRGATDTGWKPCWPDLGRRVGFADAGWEERAYGVAWRELPDEPEAVLPTLSRVHRKAVRRALREGVDVRPARTGDEVLDLVDASFRRSGLAPRNRSYLNGLVARLRARGAAIELVAEGPDGPLAALLAARCGDTVFNLFHGRVDGETHGAANLLHLRLFERAVGDGLRRVHTGDAVLNGEDGADGAVSGADAALAGIRRFKTHLGFRVESCPRGGKVHRPIPRKMRRAALGVYRLLRGDPPS